LALLAILVSLLDYITHFLDAVLVSCKPELLILNSQRIHLKGLLLDFKAERLIQLFELLEPLRHG